MLPIWVGLGNSDQVPLLSTAQVPYLPGWRFFPNFRRLRLYLFFLSMASQRRGDTWVSFRRKFCDTASRWNHYSSLRRGSTIGRNFLIRTGIIYIRLFFPVIIDCLTFLVFIGSVSCQNSRLLSLRLVMVAQSIRISFLLCLSLELIS